MGEFLTAEQGILLAAQINGLNIDLTHVLSQVSPAHAHWRTEDELPPELAAVKNLPYDRFKKEAESFLSAKGIAAEVFGSFSERVGCMIIDPFPKGTLWNPHSTVEAFREIDFLAEIDQSDYDNYPNSTVRYYFGIELGTTRVEGNTYRAYALGKPFHSNPQTGKAVLLAHGGGYIYRVKQELLNYSLPFSFEDMVVRKPGDLILTTLRDARVPQAA